MEADKAYSTLAACSQHLPGAAPWHGTMHHVSINHACSHISAGVVEETTTGTTVATALEMSLRLNAGNVTRWGTVKRTAQHEFLVVDTTVDGEVCHG